jgi:hypothetical protein
MSPLSRALLTELIDYAGLFPPAGLGMAEAVANYAAYQRRPDRWALGRLVVPVARLEEFEAALDRLAPPERLGTRWPLTAIVGPDPAADRAAVDRFRERHLNGGPAVEALEVRVASAPQIDQFTAALHGREELYCELPLAAGLPGLAAAVKRGGARAKLRTGGVKPADFPAPEAVLAFLAACRAEALPFKATAGLHHPVRGPAPLTYEPGSPQATMYGYLNLILAASLLWEGRPEASALAVLTAEDRHGLRLQAEWVDWSGVRITTGEIVRVRRDFLISVGSCSFTEPLTEIGEVGLVVDRAEAGAADTGGGP